MTVSIDEFRQYLTIDKYALDDALKEQPSLLFEVSDAYELAIAERDSAKDEIAVLEAEIDADIRTGKVRCTEPQIKHIIASDPKRTKAYDNYVRLKLRAGRLGALKESFKERGHNLREMCNLFVANYFEQASSRPTPNTDAVAYKQQRARVAAARQR